MTDFIIGIDIIAISIILICAGIIFTGIGNGILHFFGSRDKGGTIDL